MQVRKGIPTQSYGNFGLGGEAQAPFLAATYCGLMGLWPAD
jgi:hypothetical protein